MLSLFRKILDLRVPELSFKFDFCVKYNLSRKALIDVTFPIKFYCIIA